MGNRKNNMIGLNGVGLPFYTPRRVARAVNYIVFQQSCDLLGPGLYVADFPGQGLIDKLVALNKYNKMCLRKKCDATINRRGHNCAPTSTLALASPTPCSGLRSIHGQDMAALYGAGSCVNDLSECASLANANEECSLEINYFGSASGPSGDYPGVCECVKKGQTCGGWHQPGAVVAGYTCS